MSKKNNVIREYEDNEQYGEDECWDKEFIEKLNSQLADCDTKLEEVKDEIKKVQEELNNKIKKF